MPQAAVIVMAVVAVASFAMSMKQANDQKKAGKRLASLQQERLDIEKNAAELESNRQRATLKRQARAKRAAIQNNAAAQNTISTTSLSGAVNAVNMGEERELQFADASDDLSDQAFANAGQGVALNLSIAKKNANSAQVNAGINLVGDLAKIGGSATAPGGAFAKP